MSFLNTLKEQFQSLTGYAKTASVQVQQQIQDGLSGLKGLTGDALYRSAGCRVVASASDAEVKKVLAERGIPEDGITILSCPSGSCMRVDMYAALLGVDHDKSVRRVEVNMSRDLSTPWFGTLSGGVRQVPLMIIEGKVIAESIGMIKVLMTRFSDPSPKSLYPQFLQFMTAAEEVKQHADELCKYFGYCRVISSAGQFRTQGATSGPGLEWVKRHLMAVHKTFAVYERVLKQSKFLCGDHVTPADCACAGDILNLFDICELPQARYPSCYRYVTDLKQTFESRPDWAAIRHYGAGWLTEAGRTGAICKVANVDRRVFACCGPGGQETLANPIFWKGVDDVP